MRLDCHTSGSFILSRSRDRSNCHSLRKGFAGGYQFKRFRVAGEDRFHGKADKYSFSHPNDALQYLFLGGGEGRVVLRKEERHQRASHHQAAEMMGSPFDHLEIG